MPGGGAVTVPHCISSSHAFAFIEGLSGSAIILICIEIILVPSLPEGYSVAPDISGNLLDLPE